jgi:hypothetical protein
VALLLGLSAALGAQAPSPAPAPESRELAILIVGDEASAAMLKNEKSLIAEMARLRPRHERAATLQIYSYHFNKPKERAYCEKALNILKEDLLFVGIVELQKRVPRKVVYRIDRIVSPGRAAADVLGRADEMMEEMGLAVRPSEPSPQASPGGVSSPEPEGVRAWRIQVGAYAQLKNAEELVARLKEKGHSPQIQQSAAEGQARYRVYVGDYPSREAANEALAALRSEGFAEAFVVPIESTTP